MRRLLAASFATVVLLTAALPAALGGQDASIGELLAPLFSPSDDAFGNVLAVGSDGSAVVLSDGHEPLSGDVFVYDFRGVGAIATDPLGDAGEGIPENLDITSGFALKLELSPDAVAA